MARRLLNPKQQRVLFAVIVLALFMIANTLYLFSNRVADAFNWDYFAITEFSLPKFYQSMVLAHTAFGLILIFLALGFVVWHMATLWPWKLKDRRIWKKRFTNDRLRKAMLSGAGVVLLGLILAISGLFIMTEANSRDNVWAFALHVGAALLIPAIYLIHRLASRWTPSALSYKLVPGAIAALTVAGLIFHGISYTGDDQTENAKEALAAGKMDGFGAKEHVVKVAQDASGFIPAHAVPEESPFFPAPTTTTTGGYLPMSILTRGSEVDEAQLREDIETYGFAVTEAIGADACVSCHADVVEQWSTSAHRFSSFNNPFYLATIKLMRDSALTSNARLQRHIASFRELEGKEAVVKSKWCSGCHDPALMMTGKMNEVIDPTEAPAQTGLTCMSCHAIDEVHNVTGNGNYNIQDEKEDPYLFAQARGGVKQFLHDTALKAKPTVHKREMLKPFFRTSEYCGTCHKVSLDVPVNNYRWLRGQNEYDAWHDSGVARNAARTFYLPPTARTCQDCHMPLEKAFKGDVSAKDGYVRSHRFLAANTALPFIREDAETLARIENFLQDEKLSVDIAMVRQPDGEGVYLPPIEQGGAQAGQTLEFDVVVRNKGVGHTFPGGTNDSNEGWLEFTVTDASGRILTQSGGLREDGHVDPLAHFYRAIIVDRQGQRIQKRNAQDIFTPVYVRTIGPGTADVAHYSIQIPEAMQGQTLRVQARLLWRKFDRAYTEFAFFNNPSGFRKFDDVPDLPITVIAEDEVRLAVSETGQLHPSAPTGKDWMRFNDYGIGLLLQGDTRASAAAFQKVVEVAPERIDGYRNLARVAVQDGDLEAAYEYLRQCEAITPKDPQTAWVWGNVLQKDGRYPEATSAYKRVLITFPNDRATWRNLGRVYYLNSQPKQALEAFGKVLEIDPEDRVAHYHRMLVLRQLGRTAEAQQAETAYRLYQIDESAQEVTRSYRLANPEDNLDGQRIHMHELPLQNE